MADRKEIKGTLIPIGGNEDKGGSVDENYALDFITDGILSHVLAESGGPSSNIVVIPAASRIPEQVAESYLEAFDRLGGKNIHILDLENQKDAEKPESIRLIEEADCVMFSGGDQSKITAKIGGTKLHDILAERYRNEAFVIAGTSAGAMAMSKEMIAGGSSSDAMLKGAVIMREGLNLIPEVIIDTHFIKRGRFGRLAEAVAAFPKLIGLGLGEDTGLVIKACNEFKVIGSGMVIMFDASKLTHNNHSILQQGTPMSMSNMITHILSNGDRFTIDQRKIRVLPMEEAFI